MSKKTKPDETTTTDQEPAPPSIEDRVRADYAGTRWMTKSGEWACPIDWSE